MIKVELNIRWQKIFVGALGELGFQGNGSKRTSGACCA